jgi:hypothetical protein
MYRLSRVRGGVSTVGSWIHRVIRVRVRVPTRRINLCCYFGFEFRHVHALDEQRQSWGSSLLFSSSRSSTVLEIDWSRVGVRALLELTSLRLARPNIIAWLQDFISFACIQSLFTHIRGHMGNTTSTVYLCKSKTFFSQWWIETLMNSRNVDDREQFYEEG